MEGRKWLLPPAKASGFPPLSYLMKKIRIHLISLLAAAIFMMAAAIPVSADTNELTLEYTQILYMDKESKKHPSASYPYGVTSVKAIKNPKSTNSKVAGINVRKATKKKDGDVADYYKIAVETIIKKAGKTTFSYSYTDKDGIARKDIVHYIIKKYTNPVKSLKIGKKEYRKKYNSIRHFAIAKKNIKNKKLNIQLKKGWKIGAINRITSKGVVQYKNGAKIPANKKDLIEIWIQKTNNKNDLQTLYIEVK